MYIRYKLTVCEEQGAPRRTQWEESCPFDTVRMSQNATEACLRSWTHLTILVQSHQTMRDAQL